MLRHVLCFYSCVRNLCLPPSLNFTKNLDEKQKIKLLWPKTCPVGSTDKVHSCIAVLQIFLELAYPSNHILY